MRRRWFKERQQVKRQWLTHNTALLCGEVVLLEQRQRHCVKEATAVRGDIQYGRRGCCWAVADVAETIMQR
eukprot:scaffold35765_cov36-Cyclotella_meneghiniana.AAC.1